jgi:hypothetical protein
MPVEDISSSLEDLGFNVTNVRQMTAAIHIAPNGQAYFGNPTSILCYLNKKHKISWDIQAE